MRERIVKFLRLCRVVCVVKICKVSRCVVVIPNRGCGLDVRKEKILTREGEREEQEKVEGKEIREVEGGYIA